MPNDHDEIRTLEAQLEKARSDLDKARTDLETERRIRQKIITTIPDIVYIVDIKGNILDVNDAIRQLGWRTEELIGRPLAEIVAEESQDNLLKSIVERRRTNLHDIVKEKRDPGSYEQTVTLQLLRKEGTGPAWELVEARERSIVLPEYYFTTRRVHASGFALKENHVCTVGIARIITEEARLKRELLYNNTLLNALMETSPDGILVIEPNGTPISYNDCFLELWGMTREMMTTDNEMLPCAIAQLENPDEFMDKVEHLYAHPEETSIDEIRLRGGRIFERYSYPLIDQQQKNHGRVWSFRDISARKKMERKIKDENLFLDFVIESMPGSFFMYEAGENGVIFDYEKWKLVKRNKKHREVTGLSDEGIIGKSPLYIGSKNQPEVLAAIDQVIKKGSHTFEMNLESKVGTITPLLYTAHMFSHNDTIYFAGLSIDVTEKKEQEYMLNAIFNSPFHLCGILDIQGKVVKANNTSLEMIGADKKEIIGREFWKTPWWQHNEEYMERIKEYINRCKDGETITDYDLVHVDTAGKRRNIELSMSPLYGFNGKVKYLVPIGRDVTEQKRAMAKAVDYERQLLDQANQVELCNLNAAFIHDLNNSLFPVNSFVKRAIRHIKEWTSNGTVSGSLTENVLRNLEIALEPSKNTYKLADIMRQCSRGAQLEARPVAFDITQLTHMFQGLVKLRTKKDVTCDKNIELEIRSSGPLYASITPDHYRNIMVNLLNNAVDAITMDGKIILEFGEDSFGRPYVSVADDAGGIPAEYQKMIFEPRFTTKTAELGTGLGLSSSLRYASLNEAHLSFKSTDGQGTTFTLIMQRPLSTVLVE